MGCCFSKTPPHRRSPPDHPCGSPPRPPAPAFEETHVGIAPQNARTRNPPPPPPPLLEEETVKEVLSETPLPRPQLSDTPQPPPKLQEDGPETKILISKLEEAAEVVSEYSEMYSASESLSTATTATTVTDKREAEVTSRESREVRQRLKSGSPAKLPRKRPPYAGDLAGGGERRRVNRSPSPAKRNLASVSGVGPGRAREAGRARTAAAQRNAGPPSGVPRRDPGETSRRRSSSPATNRAGEASAGAKGRSPAKRAGSAGDGPANGEGGKEYGRRGRSGNEEGRSQGHRSGARERISGQPTCVIGVLHLPLSPRAEVLFSIRGQFRHVIMIH
ncbi:serine/arginine repetitive matrix protein 1-like [Rhodamnia argentea]|uniref:Serine/arginine repetitive matrix protein 1-like n=1 Tax=Rhodamnia argentea TaxID=178133 RepID=A0A8B8MSV4_9MYRT|nr:serine/arginine repetitive matrix protein 1-like [Rhodamnia argentea]